MTHPTRVRTILCALAFLYSFGPTQPSLPAQTRAGEGDVAPIVNQAAPEVIITEIMYHPLQQSGPENTGFEYIELFNAGSARVHLAGWQLTDGVDFTFPPVDLDGGAYLVVAADVNQFAILYPDVKNVVGGWSGSLRNSGERIELADAGGVVVDSVRYADEGDWAVRELGPADRGHRGWTWSEAHDGGGWSLELMNPAMPNEYGQNWAARNVPMGTPGRKNSIAADDIAPLILDVAHLPAVPRSSEPVAVTARVMDELQEGVTVRLHYRVDASTASDWHTLPHENPASYQTVAMLDDGLHGDARAGDGIYGGLVPPQADKSIVEFFVEAVDAGGKSRTWPAPCRVDNALEQVTNALFLVDDSLDAQRPAGSQTLYYLIMLERDRAELAYIGSTTADSDSEAEMSGTFISVDGRGTQVAYCAGIRNRGKGSRTNAGGSYRNNYHVNFAHDRPWDKVTAVNIKNRFGYLQVLGDAIWSMADLPAATTTAIQLRINGENLAFADRRMFGSYTALEVIDHDFADKHFPDDPSGNAYRCINDQANLAYRGTNPASYRYAYEKQTNVAADDYNDIISLTRVLNNTPPENYVEEVGKVINLSEWLRYLAVDALAGNLEGGLSTPRGDDYAMYRGVRDPRFWLIPHDLDTLFGQGDTAPDIGRDIHVYAGLDGLHELLTDPEIVTMYHKQLIDLVQTVFSPGRFDPLVDQMLGGWVPDATIESIKQYVRQRNAAVLAQIPQALTVGSDLPVMYGYYHTTTNGVLLSGAADASRTRSVVAGGRTADWSATDGKWQSGGALGPAETLIAQGAAWKYLDDGSDQGTAWRGVSFDDSGWSTGNAQLGYGDGDEAKVVGYGPNANAKYVTTYFRHAFDVADASGYVTLQLRLLRDDGAVVYLNGTEVVRSNMPSGPISYTTTASANLTGADESTFVEFTASPALLVRGTNVMAVEVHQFSGTSADISFDLSLDAVRPPDMDETLMPGVNRIMVKAFDGLDGSGQELARTYADVWYDTGLTNDYPKPDARGSVAPRSVAPALDLIVRGSYLPGVPVLVRVELLDGAVAIQQDRWEAVAVLSIDNSNVGLSPDRIHLYNGVGSALVMFTGSGDVVLTADVEGTKATASLADWSDRPVQTVSGSLEGSATWSGICRITGGDLTIKKGATLTLEPGTWVLIDGVQSGTGGTDVQIEGAIQANGMRQSPVSITASKAGENWGELRFVNAEPSAFSYTDITRAGRSPGVGHTNSGPAIRVQGSKIVFDHVCLTDNAGKVMHATSGSDLVFRRCLLARSAMGPEIEATGLLFEDGWITEMHNNDDADGIYVHSQQAGQKCILSRGAIVDTYDDGIDTLGSQITVQDFIIRGCKDKGVSVFNGQTTIDHCLIVENNVAPEDPTIASVAAKADEGGTATVNISRSTIVAARRAGYTDAGIQSNNKYNTKTGTIIYHVTDSIIDATDSVSVQLPYLESDIHVDHSDLTSEVWQGTGNIHADPLFVDVQNHNYGLRANSPCIGTAGDGGDQGYYAAVVRAPSGNTLAEDTVWPASKGPYRITGELIVPAGVTLTILPGTSVFFQPAARMTVRGQLVAEGTEDSPIRFTRTPGSQGTWTGLQFTGSTAESRIACAVVEYGRTNDGMVGVENSHLLLDHVTFDHTDLRRVRVAASWLTVRNCTFTDIFGPNEPPTTDNMSEHIWGSVVAGGQFVVENCVFGKIKGHNDAIDVDGPARPKPPLQILNNVFTGGGDDALDLEGDAHVEGNTFMNFHKDRYNTAARQSNVISSGAAKYYVVVRNVFYNCDHVAQVKDGAFMTFVNNTVMDATASAFFFQIPELGGTPGKGIDVDSCIFRNVPTLFTDFYVNDPKWGTTRMTVNRSIVADAWLGLGEGNMDVDPLFVSPPSDFHLKSMSPAVSAGTNGLDMGAYVPAGASVFVEPGEVTWRTSASLTVSGPGITHYRYSINDPNGSWSEERPVETPIELTGLANGGSYRIFVVGKNSAGVWQTVPNASRPWRVDTSHGRLVINELLASNVSAEERGGAYPDLVELYYDGPHPLDLSGMSMTDDANQPAKFMFPQGTTMQSGQYLVLLADSQTSGGGIHLGFALDVQGGTLRLYDRQGSLVDSVDYGHQLPDLSIGRVGAEGRWYLTAPTFGQSNIAVPLGDPAAVKVNEWLAGGEVLFADDFIELYNPQSSPVDLGGCYVTGQPATQPNACRLAPLTFVAGQGFGALTADRQNRPGHVDLKLSLDGGLIGLLDSESREIDKVIYGPQTPDVSQGRSPDGASTIEFFGLPTPGVPNPVSETTTGVSKTLIAMDSVWSYEQSGVAPDASWYQPAYADSAWPTGPGVLYVEDATLPGPKNTPLQLGQLTYYFRTHFSLETDPASVTSLAMTALVDDGAVFYLNGREVYRLGMPAGAISHTTLASRGVGNAVLEGPFQISADALVRGDNVLAVEVHQASATSSDIVFAMQLDVQFDSEPAEDPLARAYALLDGLRITELMYNAPEGDSLDYIELRNIGDVDLDLTGVRFTDGVEFVFPSLTLAPGGCTVVAADTAAFQSRYGGQARIAGQYSGRLSNGGEKIVLSLPQPLEAAILRFSYVDVWYPTTDGLGDSLTILDPTVAPRLWNEPASWSAAAPTPGKP